MEEAKRAPGSVPMVYYCYIISAALSPSFCPTLHIHPHHPPPTIPPTPLRPCPYLTSPPPAGPLNTTPLDPTTYWGSAIPASAFPPHKGQEYVASQCTAQPYSGVWICRSPSPPSLLHIEHIIVGVKPSPRSSVSEVASPPYFLPLCDENSPGGVQLAVSPPKSPHQITGLLGKLPGRNDLAVWGTLPPSPRSWTGGPRSSVPSGG